MVRAKLQLPTQKDLARAFAKEKRALTGSDLAVRVLVMPSSWTILTGDLGLNFKPPREALATVLVQLTVTANAERLAREALRRLRADYFDRVETQVRSEPPLRPSEVPPALRPAAEEESDVDEDGEPLHPLILEAREAAKLQDVDWEPPPHLRRLNDDEG